MRLVIVLPFGEWPYFTYISAVKACEKCADVVFVVLSSCRIHHCQRCFTTA